MPRPSLKNSLVLSISPSTRGFGFAVLEDHETLVDWGVKSIRRDKNTLPLKKAQELILLYKPGLLVLEDYFIGNSRRSQRIRELSHAMETLAQGHSITVVTFSREQVRRVFFADNQGTKHALAEILAARFPDELSFHLPPKRRLWTSEDHRMAIFEAVALALTSILKKRRTPAKGRP